MNCAEFESVLADYVDGTLSASQSAAVEQHSASCVACRQFLADVSAMAGLLERVEDVVPPAELINRIAFQAPHGRVRDGFDVFGFWPQMKSKWLEPLLQPRLAMGMAMTVLSFSMLARCTGTPVQHIQAQDLNPERIWANLEDRALRTKDRLVKNYENLRVVYEIESRLNDVNPSEQDQSKQDLTKQQDRSKQKDQGAKK